MEAITKRAGKEEVLRMRGWHKTQLGMLSCLFVFCIGSTCKVEELKELSKKSVRIPAGISDGQRGYVQNVQGVVEALDMKSGRVMWTSTIPATPHLQIDDRLIAGLSQEKNEIRMVAISIKDGNQVCEIEPIALPEWISQKAGTGQSFQYSVDKDDEGLVVTWKAQQSYAGGAPAPPKIIEREKKAASGRVRIDLNTGESKQIPETTKEEQPAFLKDVQSHPYQMRQRPETRPLVTESHAAILEWSGGESERLTLRRWNLKTQKEEEPVVLMQGIGAVVQTTLDGYHIVVREAGKQESPWIIFNIDTGKVSGKIRFEERMQDISVLSGRACYALAGEDRRPVEEGTWLVARTLNVLNLETETIVWQREIVPARVFSKAALPK